MSLNSLSAKLGPGIIFAATAIGISHLVQATRAGADFGLALAGFILLACVIKYPAFRFGSEYAAATGQSLVDNYFRQGPWAILVLGLDLLISMFVGTAALALVSAGLVGSALSLSLDPKLVVMILLALCAALLIAGKYHVFEQVSKGFVALLLVLIVVATTLALSGVNWQEASLTLPGEFDRATLLFIIALSGVMPTALIVSVFQSLWVCAKSRDMGAPFNPADARFDFNLGYVISTLLAFGFLILGTVLMYQPGLAVADSPNGFAAQLISLFTTSIGGFAYPIISLVVVVVMVSSLLAVVDACPRVIGVLISYRKQAGAERAGRTVPRRFGELMDQENKHYALLVIIQCSGALVLLMLFASSFRTFVDFATSIAFVTAPLIAFLNHRAMFSTALPPEHRPGKIMETWSWLGILSMGLFGVSYICFGILGLGR
ncbi:MAG: hypothetical protein OXN26_18225 [Gammaproteobacteria bacterium]|nr:hypothetical protein [Gammaproteobacteria bacterium]